MLSMPDQLDEIYQTIMTLPVTEDVGTRLEEAIGKLRLQEDIEADLAGDLAAAVPGVAMPAPAAAARQRRLVAVGSSRRLG